MLISSNHSSVSFPGPAIAFARIRPINPGHVRLQPPFMWLLQHQGLIISFRLPDITIRERTVEITLATPKPGSDGPLIRRYVEAARQTCPLWIQPKPVHFARLIPIIYGLIQLRIKFSHWCVLSPFYRNALLSLRFIFNTLQWSYSLNLIHYTTLKLKENISKDNVTLRSFYTLLEIQKHTFLQPSRDYSFFQEITISQQYQSFLTIIKLLLTVTVINNTNTFTDISKMQICFASLVIAINLASCFTEQNKIKQNLNCK